MKRISILIWLLVTPFLYGQKYILLDEVSHHSLKKYTLNAKKMYKMDKNIEMYNFLNDSGGLLFLITILPDLENSNSWKEISFDEINKNKILIIDVLDYKESKMYNKIFLVKKENQRYYVAKNCLVESFFIESYSPELNVSGKNVINLTQNIKTYQDIRKVYEKDFPMENKKVELVEQLKHIYLSGIEKGEIYRFWTFDDWNDYHGINEHRGIDRFAYIEGKGIVGGSYDFYFDQTADGFKRIVRDDIMWAKELFPERQ